MSFGDECLGDDFVGPKRYNHAEICVYRLAQFVKFPVAIKKIVIIGHTRPGVDRMKIEMSGESDLRIDGEDTLMYPDTGFLAQRWIKTGHKYISIEY